MLGNALDPVLLMGSGMDKKSGVSPEFFLLFMLRIKVILPGSTKSCRIDFTFDLGVGAP